MKKAQSKSHDRASLKPARKRSIAIAVLALVALPLLYWVYSTYTSADQRTHAEQRVKEALSSIDLGTAPVFSATRDNGCFTNATGWFGSTTTCAYAGEKFYVGKGSVDEDLRRADETITSLGWQRTTTGEPGHASDGGTKMVWVSYSNPSKDLPGLTLTYFSNRVEPGSSQYTPDVELQKILEGSDLADNEYLYGVSVYYNYQP